MRLSALLHHVNWLDLTSYFSHWPVPAGGGVGGVVNQPAQVQRERVLSQHLETRGGGGRIYCHVTILDQWKMEHNIQFTCGPKHYPGLFILNLCEKSINSPKRISRELISPNQEGGQIDLELWSEDNFHQNCSYEKCRLLGLTQGRL